MEYRPAVRTIFRPDMTAMRRHDPPGDRQADAKARLLCREKRLEQARQVARRDAGTRVGNGHFHCAMGAEFRAHGEVPPLD